MQPAAGDGPLAFERRLAAFDDQDVFSPKYDGADPKDDLAARAHAAFFAGWGLEKSQVASSEAALRNL